VACSDISTGGNQALQLERPTGFSPVFLGKQGATLGQSWVL